MRVNLWPVVGVVVAWLLGSAPAGAASLHVSASGFWIAGAPSTPYSEAGDAYAFSFDLPKTFVPDWYSSADIAATTEFTNFKYYLNGVLVPGVPQDIAFFDSSLFGGLQLGYSSSYSVEFIGPVIATNFGQPTAMLVLGTYAEYPNMNYAVDGDGVPLNQGTDYTMSVVPEPQAWAMMTLGVIGIGAAARAGRRRFAPA